MNTLEPVLHGLLDYGGLFPPARLSLPDALSQAARFPSDLQSPNIVGNDLVVRAQHLEQLDDDAMLGAGWKPGRPCFLSVANVALLDAGDVAMRIVQFNEASSMGRVPRRVNQLETKFDGDLSKVAAVAAQVTPARYRLGEAGVRIVIEFRWADADWAKGRERVMALLDMLNADPELPPVGLKVRCSGQYGLRPETLALVLQDLAKRAAPLKATQGLHHPLAEPKRHDNPVGFAGLAIASRLVRVLDLGASDLVACMTEADPEAFRFEGELAWRDHVIDKAELGSSEVVPLRIGLADLVLAEQDLMRLWPQTAVLVSQGH